MLTRPKKTKVDRIVVVSDMNCYNTNAYGYGYGGYGRSESLVSLLTRYRAEVNKGTFYYSINLRGGDQAQMDPQNKHTLLLSGFSEKVFNLFAQFEEVGGVQESEKGERVIPTIDELRSRYRLSGDGTN
jgi:hypothetical protein